MSCQLLVNAEGTDCLEAKEKVHVIGNRLKMLLKDVTRHIKELEKILDISSSQLVSLFYDLLITASYNSQFLSNLHFCYQNACIFFVLFVLFFGHVLLMLKSVNLNSFIMLLISCYHTLTTPVKTNFLCNIHRLIARK